MAQPDFTATPAMRVTAPKPRMTVYFALLILSLVCMLVACLLMFLEVRRFGGFGTVPQRIASVERAEAREILISHRGHSDHRDSRMVDDSLCSVASFG